MWIVRLALRRPYTFVVAAMLVFILGVFTIVNTPTDIFPNIDIPIISVVFNYSGMSSRDMEQHIVTGFERILTTTVNNIEHTESQSLYGIAIVKIFFQPNTKIEAGIAQVTAICQTTLRQMPPGTQPPLVIQYSASNVPILQLSFASDTLSEQGMFDQAVNFVRPRLVTVPGVQIPYPYGGKQRQVMVDLDPERLYAWGISPSDVSAAIGAQNLILPAGTTKIGTQEYPVVLNSSPLQADDLNNLPIKTANGTTVYIKDVAHVRDGFQVQTSLVHASGKRGVLLSILKNGGASTLDVVAGAKRALALVSPTLPKGLKVTPLFDQSLYVRASIEGVVREAVIAAALTALMILIFLGSWRSTIVVITSIPLSILVSIILMSWLGETLNVMTLGGLALAVGILVDDATVEIENIHRNLHQRKRLVQAILDGASQIAVPAFVSTLCICIVFVPVVFISGSAKYLFIPLGMAVVFAMLTSYLLSRTLVPTMVHYLLASEVEMYGGTLDPNDPHADPNKVHGTGPQSRDRYYSVAESLWWSFKYFAIAVAVVTVVAEVGVGAVHDTPFSIGAGLTQFVGGLREAPVPSILSLLQMVGIAVLAIAALRYVLLNSYIWRFHASFDNQFEKLRQLYGGLLAWALQHRFTVLMVFMLLVASSMSLMVFGLIGKDFFPSVDAGQIRLHVRAAPGTRIEQTERIFADVEKVIEGDIPQSEVDTLLDNIGIPNSGINLSLSDGSLMSSADGEILIALKSEHKPTNQYIDKIGHDLRATFPGVTFYFAPADIVTQVLNFGIAAPIDVQIEGTPADEPKNFEIAKRIGSEVASLPGAADVRLEQVPNTPDLRLNVDRTQANYAGLTQRDVANDMLVSLSGTAQQNPNFWQDTVHGVQYSVLVQTPQYFIDSINALQNQPVVPSSSLAPGRAFNREAQLLGSVATLNRSASPTNITHYNPRPTFDVLAGVRGMDLSSVANGVRTIVDQERKNLPRGSLINIRGQVQSMDASFSGLSYGMVFAIVLVYLLMVINFQSWLDPLIILMALPGALVGILWMLFVTQTTINVPSFMGAIMSIGVATANSILMITFANDLRKEGANAHDAALAAGMTRLRPVIMTALAMIIGMLPMSLGLGEGGEQNAPLGRAVIGGLLLATFATLFFVPVVYSKLRVKAAVTQVEEELR
jgi:multidrug efflux pump subunit AcrB